MEQGARIGDAARHGGCGDRGGAAEVEDGVFRPHPSGGIRRSGGNRNLPRMYEPHAAARASGQFASKSDDAWFE